jgi:hypothetical protein
MDEAIRQLVAESAIRKVLFTYCRGVDRLDPDLMKSIYHPEGIDQHHARYTGSGTGFADYIMESFPARNFVSTSHQITNCLIEFDSVSRASVESYFVAAQSNGTDILWMIGRYLDLFEERNGEWKILHRRVVHDMNWVTHLEEAFAPTDFLLGRQDREDPSYAAL